MSDSEYKKKIDAQMSERRKKWLETDKVGGNDAFASEDESGMTLRDYYIGQALAGMCSNPENDGWDGIGTAAVEVADMALAARRDAT